MDLHFHLEKGKQNPIGYMTTRPERAESQVDFFIWAAYILQIACTSCNCTWVMFNLELQLWALAEAT